MLIFTNESVLIDYGVSYLRIAGFFLFTDRNFAVLSGYHENKRTCQNNSCDQFLQLSASILF